MVKRTVTKEADLVRALYAAPNYSAEFTEHVRMLAGVLAEVIPGQVEHNDDMNYSAGQRISLWLNRLCKPSPPRDSKAEYQIIVYVSSKGPFFTSAALKLESASKHLDGNIPGQPSHCWVAVPHGRVSKKIKALQMRITAAMESQGYSLLEGPALSQLVEGKVTELDGKPAMVFEVLFSEV